MNRSYIKLFFLLISISTIFGAEDDPIELKIDKESWNIGISGFSDKGISSISSYLLNSLPLLLYNEISDIEDHRLSDSERIYFSENYFNEKLNDLVDEKNNLHDTRDKLLFSEQSRNERRSQYRDLSEQIEDKVEEIETFRKRDVSEVEIPDSLPVELKQFDEDEEQILEHHREKAAHFMKREELDFFITGSLEQIDDLFFLNISAYNRTGETPVIVFEETASEELLEELIVNAGVELRSIILGRPWSGISVKTYPASALIMVNGTSIGVGSALVRDLEPGFVTLSISENGYVTDNRQVYLPAEDLQDYEITLEKGETDSLFLFSDPPGADVYFGALWMGETPLLTNFPDQRVRIKVSKEEYMPFYVASDQLSGDSVTVQLSTDLYEKELALKDAKSSFYRALGWFSLSVGIPVVMGGIYQNLDSRYSNYALSYSQTGNSDHYDKAMDYKRQADIAYMGYWGGLALSGSLLVNVFIKLWNYIKTAEESTED